MSGRGRHAREGTVIELQRVEILSRPAGPTAPRPLPEGVRLRELGPDAAPRICALARSQGQTRTPERVAGRFGHGLRYFMLETEDGEGIAWLWLAAGVPRYLDELCWQVEMQPGQGWLRDAAVAPAHRGRRLYAALLEAVAAHLHAPIEYFVDIESSNQASLRAHRAAGFTPVARVHGVVLGPRWVLRQRPPAALPPVTALRPHRRLLRLSPEELAWHEAHIA